MYVSLCRGHKLSPVHITLNVCFIVQRSQAISCAYYFKNRRCRKLNTATGRIVDFRNPNSCSSQEILFLYKDFKENVYDTVSDGIAEDFAVLVKRFSS
jgi:hypothetical protein